MAQVSEGRGCTGTSHLTRPRESASSQRARRGPRTPCSGARAVVTMARVFVAGSTTGLGLAAVRRLIDDDQPVVLHARDAALADSIRDLADRAAGVVVGDLSNGNEPEAWQTRETPLAASMPSSVLLFRVMLGII